MKTLLAILSLLALNASALSPTTNCGTLLFASDSPDPFTGATNFMQGSYCGLVGGVRYRVDHGYDLGEISWGPGLTWDSSVDIEVWWFDTEGAYFWNKTPGTGNLTINKAVSSAYPGEYFILRNLDAGISAPISNGIVPMPKALPKPVVKGQKSAIPTPPPLPPVRFKAIPRGAEALMLKSPKKAPARPLRHVDWEAIKKLPMVKIPPAKAHP